MTSITTTSQKFYAFIAASLIAVSTQGVILVGIEQMADAPSVSTSQQAVVTLPTVTVVSRRS